MARCLKKWDFQSPYPHGAAAAQDALTSALVRSAPFAPLPLPSNASLGDGPWGEPMGMGRQRLVSQFFKGRSRFHKSSQH